MSTLRLVGAKCIGRGSPSKRIIEIIFRLSKTSMTIRRLAGIYGVNEKTIRRDIDVIEQMGIPIYDDEGDNSIDSQGPPVKLWRIDPSWSKRFQ
jgi:hypothetical protein